MGIKLNLQNVKDLPDGSKEPVLAFCIASDGAVFHIGTTMAWVAKSWQDKSKINETVLYAPMSEVQEALDKQKEEK